MRCVPAILTFERCVGEYADAMLDDVNGVFNAGTNVNSIPKA